MAGIHGYNTQLSIEGTDVGEIISITGPDQTRDAIDISTMDSASKWREFVPGMLDAGEVTFELNYPAEATLLQAQFTATAGTWLLEFPDSTTWQAEGFITSLGHAIPFDDKVTQSCTIKFTGARTIG